MTSGQELTERGIAFLLKVGDNIPVSTYTTVAGMRVTQLSVNGDPVSPNNAAFEGAVNNQSIRSVSISAFGVFTGSAKEAVIKSNALSGAIWMIMN